MKFLENFWNAANSNWSANCVINDSTCAGTFTMTDTELYDLVATLLIQDNAKLLQ